VADALAKLETRIGDVADSPLSIDMVEGPDAAAEGDALERLTHTR
jgi:hypothetical protein